MVSNKNLLHNQSISFSLRVLKWDPISLASSYYFIYPLLQSNEILDYFFNFPISNHIPHGVNWTSASLDSHLGETQPQIHTHKENHWLRMEETDLWFCIVFWAGITIFCLGSTVSKTWTSRDSFTVQNTAFSSLIPAWSKNRIVTESFFLTPCLNSLKCLVSPRTWPIHALN